jgi:hypothetical protein
VNAGIISFNWDCLIEIACHRRGRQVTYSSNVDSDLRLVKPHGSIDHVELTRENWEQVRPTHYGQRLEEIGTPGDRVVVRATNPAEAGNQTLFPFDTKDWLVVPPGARKSFDSLWLKFQWKHALELLRTSRRITVIGYSLPEFDFRSKLLFRMAVLARRRIDTPSIRIIDPNPGSLVERLTSLGYNRIECVAEPWEDWIPGEVGARAPE